MSHQPQSVHRSVANDRYGLWKLGISHVVNAAHGRPCCQGCHAFYGSSVDYYGVPADDSPSFDLSPYFFPSADYIKRALDTAGGNHAAFPLAILKNSLLLLLTLFEFSLWSSSGFCPLCSGREQVRLHRPGLPDDPPASQPFRGHPQGQRAPLDLPKQRLLEAAANSGCKAAGVLLSGFPTA